MVFLRLIWRWFLRLLLAFIVTSIVSVILFRWIPIPVTPLMLIRCYEQSANGKDMKLEKDWVELEQISPHLQLAVVCSEDQMFLRHYGFDFAALKKAMVSNEKSRKIRGGSTISQQTAKNVFLWPGRTYLRKGLEAWFTLLIETFWSKERIMEVYLNVIEFGDGIYGAEAASRHYFKVKAKKVTKEQAATLATLLPNPREYGPKIKGPYIQKRKQWVLKQMRFWGGKLNYDEENKD